MIIDLNNPSIGNKAMASVLLLYYHLLDEGGITHDQTVYIDPKDFNGFDFLNVQVEDGLDLDIDVKMLREGAVIYLLCELNDMIIEHEPDFHRQPLTQKVLAALSSHEHAPIPEIADLLDNISLPEKDFDHFAHQKLLQRIYKKYVCGFLAGILENESSTG